MNTQQESIIFENALIVDEAGQRTQDVWVFEGLIRAIDSPGAFQNAPEAATARKINLKGKWLASGLIDVHVHLREPGFEYKETIASGVRAAVCGGFTSVAAMANTRPVNDHAVITKFIVDRAREENLARVFPIAAATKGLNGESLAEIGSMIDAGACAVSDDGMPIMNSYLMRKVMEYAASFDVALISHAEDLNLSGGIGFGSAAMNEGAQSALLGVRGNPAASEEIMVAREIALARLTGARVHIAHLSTAVAAQHVRRAKDEGLKITAEVTPHHLILNDSNLGSYCTHHKMAPPLRTPRDQEALLQALNDGVIDIIASDHAPHGCVDKQTALDLAANGILGLQTTLPLMLGLVQAGKLKLNRMMTALTIAPAKLINQPHLGMIKVGMPADLVVIDPKVNWTLRAEDIVSKSFNSPFLGREFQGRAVMTLVNGSVKYEVSKWES